ncbi:FAD/NAD(P)-binding domain-containing protein [Decorospora gaudefroyi]|uniref:FAD/NAD(P)-binding domain-containing protein n=1 Tax=Decorospora gaudefroyi TaxID=184978 RepID=A0A6A5K361_9PLEO|nr:FAD/NAD(P)-binding domain-containing protein [Decorospora gaudefroyi]
MTKHVVVVGSSIAGLMHAVALKSHGHDVVVLELRSEQQLQARAAGLSLWEKAQKVITTYIPDVDLNEIVFHNPALQIADGNGSVLAEIPMTEDVRTSCWAGIHGLLWMACEKEAEGHGTVTIMCGHQVLGVTEQGDRVVVAYKDNRGTEGKMDADLVIAADGARSRVRSLVLPDVKTEYAGYVAWRAQCLETDAPEELHAATQGKLPIYMFDGSYILAYLSPNQIGSMRPGERVIEWCWYDPCDPSSPEFADYMTDVNGIRHNVTVPANLLRPEVWEAQLNRRDAVLSPLWKKVIQDSGMPLLTAVQSFDNTKASFFSGKVLLAGEAFIQIRPHLGASCDIAGLSALTLPGVLNGDMSLEEWEAGLVKHAMEKSIGSKATGIFGMTGKWPEGYTPESAAEFADKA